MYSTKALRTVRDVPKPNIRGLYVDSPKFVSESLADFGIIVRPEELAFEASLVDAVNTIVPRPEYSNLGTAAEVSTFDSRVTLQWLHAMRKAIVNASPGRYANQPAGGAFEKMLRMLTYDVRAGHSLLVLSMSFCYYYMTLKALAAQIWERDQDTWERCRLGLWRLAEPFDSIYTSFSKQHFCVTTCGRLCWAPWTTETDDKICVFQGSRISFVARYVPAKGWRYVEPCFILGLMDGELWDLPSNEWFFMKIA